MGTVFYKCLIFFALITVGVSSHPVFVSVTEIEHNLSTRTLTVSCKVFTDDLEKALRQNYSIKIDLADAKLKAAMNPLVDGYIKKHLSIIADDKRVNLQFLGFLQQEEGIISIYEVKNISAIKKLDVENDILYENQPAQTGIIHVMVNGVRKSSRLDNPDKKASFLF